MGALIRSAIVCVVVLAAGDARAGGRAAAPAAGSAEAAASHARATQLSRAGEYDQALAAVDEGLAHAPAHRPLLLLKGEVLVRLRDYTRALEAYKAYLAATEDSADRRSAQQIVDQLTAVLTTFLDLSVANGPAVIHLDSRTQPTFCTAAPACHKGVLPGAYKVIAERPGFQPWTGPVTVAKSRTAKLEITLIEKPSQLAVTVAQPGATITVDAAAYTGPLSVPAGSHRVAVTLAGHIAAERDVVAAEGQPIELAVALIPRTRVRGMPAGTELRVDGQVMALGDGGLDLAPGAHVVVAHAAGYVDGTIAIPADRPADYAIAIELKRPPPPVAIGQFTLRRKLAVISGSASLVALAGGVILGVQSKHLDHDAFTRCPSPTAPCRLASEADDLNQRARTRATQANIAYGVSAGAAIAAGVLWLIGAPESRLAVTPSVGAVAGLDLAVRF